MSWAEQPELHPAPEEESRQELRSFPFYSEAEKTFLKGQEMLKKSDEDSVFLEWAFLKFHAAVEMMAKKFLVIFKPTLNLSFSYYSETSFKTDLRELRYRVNLINGTDHNLFLSYMEDRNKLVHEDEFSLSRKEVESYVKLVRDLFLNINSKSCKLWEELITQTDLGGLFEAKERRESVRDTLIEDIVEQRDEWVNPFFDSEEDWYLWGHLSPEFNEDYFPLVPLDELDFVAGNQEEASVDNPARIKLFARLLTAEDLADVKPETFKDFLDHDFPVVVFIPERHREDFLTKLNPIKEKVSFVSYYYDKKAELYLTLSERT